MKKILYIFMIVMFFMTVIGCENPKENVENNQKEETKNYNFGQLVNVKVNDNVIIKGYVLEDNEDKVILLEENSTRQSNYDNVQNIINELSNSWTNVDNINLLSLDDLFDNLTLKINDDVSGYVGIKDEENHFLYSENPYWLASNDYKEANCYEIDNKCNWASYNAFVHLVDKNLNLYVRLSFEISKEYIEG